MEQSISSENPPIWTMGTGTTDLFEIVPDFAVNFSVRGISYDGRFIGGSYWAEIPDSFEGQIGFILDRNNPGNLLTFPGFSILDIDDSGSSAVGYESDSSMFGPGIASWLPSTDQPWQHLAPIPDTLDGFLEVSAMDGAGTIAVGAQSQGLFSLDRLSVYWQLTGDSPTAIAIPTLPVATGTSINSNAVDISRNGAYIVGNQFDENQLRPYIYTLGGGVTEIPVFDGRASGVSNTGRVVGSTMNQTISFGESTIDQPMASFVQEGSEFDFLSGAWVYDSEAGVRSINQWLADSGADVGFMNFGTADAISEDGRVIVGRLDHDLIFFPESNEDGQPFVENVPFRPISEAGYIAREGSGAINPEEFFPTLNSGSQPTNLGLNLLNMTLHGAHHIPLQMQGAERYGWIIGDFARNNFHDSKSALAEVGGAIDLLDRQLVAGIGIGQSWVDQDLLYGGDITMDGQYLLGELSYRASDSPFIFTLTGAYGAWDTDITRNYLNGGGIDRSIGSTDVTSGAIRARVDWIDAANLFDFGITPKLEYTVTRTKSDAYAESGGGFPAAFNSQRETVHQFRYGLTAARQILDQKGLLRIRAEGVHRFDGSNARSSGTILGLGTFNLDGQSVRQNWLLLGLDFDYALSDSVTLTSGLSTSTSGDDPVFGSTLGLRMKF